MIIVASIPHTGTHFVMDLLGFPKPWRGVTQGWYGKGEARFDHIMPQQKHLFLPMMKEATVFIPLRHPRSVLKSWEDRKKPVTVLKAMWRLLVDEIDPLDPIYIPVDSERRDEALEVARERSGLELKTNWEPLGVKHNNSFVDWRALPEYDADIEKAVEAYY